ncbi:4-hydroxy-tetrahydrodipicolinate reductase [Hirschia baltica]|uniref:4-hydroxy-tetrahydrodipicolinate reductase n=1 Tax=Hirschia baltica (strain ATCC 49814 / DSM 5838 / IFAM 1418) TaxID=582402 RepID=C6XII4_HIRBI|nr:4-hydroxy-tetrahydrodipicolinate reductase [Hirschia baltica]ACT60791.1 dihydrodipicolinate reductase [Hirschia baltica ATCC 49814]
MTLKIAIAGVAGRMGQSLVRACSTLTDCEIVGGTERPGSGALDQDIGVLAGLPPSDIKVSLSPAEAARHADIWIDFTAPVPTLASMTALDTTGVKAVIIGTTGFNEAEDEALQEFSKRFSIVKAGNFSLGVAMLSALVEQAAARLGDDWDIEVLETHHRRKVDAPSGTALMLGEAAAKGRNAPLDDLKTPPYDGITGEREAGKIGFSVRRAGGVIGDHEVMFGSDEELISLRHTALDRNVFAKGAIRAGQWAIQQPVGFYTIRDVLDL